MSDHSRNKNVVLAYTNECSDTTCIISTYNIKTGKADRRMDGWTITDFKIHFFFVFFKKCLNKANLLPHSCTLSLKLKLLVKFQFVFLV